ncbi:MAG: energy-coupling factor transporter transmembrane protein EcfT [Anaerolineae bacterium]|nr:energy-coupling factor transporter transmembrane protein EcfT [Anaerolineae bacterium]
MLVTWKYRPRNSFVEKFDPRARWFFSFLVLFSIIQFWDIRFLVFFFALVMLQYKLTRLTWAETRRVWTFVLILVVGIISLNALFTGRGGPGEVLQSNHILWRVEWRVFGLSIHPTITVERLWFAGSQIVRMLSISVLFFIIPYTMDPRLYGVTFHGMGFPEKFAFSMDLAFRFVPTLARDFNTTLDAQRARGYEVEKLDGGIFAQIRKMAPLIVPVTMNAIISGEDITNAMDLRCFAIRERTWVHKLTYRQRDYLLIGLGALIFLASLGITVFFHVGTFWVPDWALAWVG